MTSFKARFYDGLSPQVRLVDATLDSTMLRLVDSRGEVARWPLFDLFLPPQDKSQPEAYVSSRAAPDARLVIADPAAQLALARAVPKLARLRRRGSHGGRRAVTVLACIAAAAVLVVGVLLWRGPEMLAPLVPQSWQARLGDEIVDAMVGNNGRCTAPKGMAALDVLVAKLKAGSLYRGELRVEVIDSEVVNAFAVPGGRIMVFRGLLETAETPDEVAAVLAHEMGHVVYNHPTRGLLRQLGLSALEHLAFGSYGDSVSTATSLGQTLLALRNSRDAERDADAFAIATLERAHLKADGLNAFFSLLERKSLGADLGWLSTHPALDERRQATRHDSSGMSALSAAQWQSLRSICGAAKSPSVRPSTPDRQKPQAPDAPSKGRGNGTDRI